MRLKTVVPPDDIQRYYNDNIQQYQTPEQVRASHILLKIDGKDEAAVRKRAEALLAQVKGGADFAALATKESEDEGSKASGGDVGLFGRGRMVPEFETAAFAMQPGQTSDLVRSQFGFHIIRVDREEGGRNPAARRSAAADPGTARRSSRPTCRCRSAPSSCRRASRIPAIWPKPPASRG